MKPTVIICVSFMPSKLLNENYLHKIFCSGTTSQKIDLYGVGLNENCYLKNVLLQKYGYGIFFYPLSYKLPIGTKSYKPIFKEQKMPDILQCCTGVIELSSS